MIKTLLVFDRPLYPLRGGAEARALDHIDYLENRGIRYDLFLIDRYYNYNQWDETGIEFLLNKKVENIYLHQVLNNRTLDTIYHKLLSRCYTFLNKEPGINSFIHCLPGMRRKFREVISHNKYDFIFFNHTYVSAALTKKVFIPCKKYIDTHDIYSNLIKEVLELQKLDLRLQYSGSKKILSRIKVPRFDYDYNLNKELQLLCNFDKVITLSNDEYQIFKECDNLTDKVHLIPKISENNHYRQKNIDSNKYNKKIHILEPKKNKNKFKILFFGSQYDPNIHGINKFYYNVLPLLNEQVELVIAGGVSSIFANKVNPKLKILGFIDDIYSLYASVDAVIIPIFYGSGVSIKAVEALSYGKPVISTKKGVRGLPVQHEKEVLIAENIDDFPYLIEKIRVNPVLSSSLSQCALNYIERQHSKSSVYAQMDKIFFD